MIHETEGGRERGRSISRAMAGGIEKEAGSMRSAFEAGGTEKEAGPSGRSPGQGLDAGPKTSIRPSQVPTRPVSRSEFGVRDKLEFPKACGHIFLLFIYLHNKRKTEQM